MVETVLQAALRGAELTRQMLAFSRRQPLQPKPIEVNELIDGTMKMLRGTHRARPSTSQLHAADDLPPVFIDAAQLETALVNIAINARDAMPTAAGSSWRRAPSEFDETDRAGSRR